MLFQPDRHEQLNAGKWSEDAARRTIEEIALEAHATFNKERLFPAHPTDEPSHHHMGSGHYYGAGGVLWALDYLRRETAVAIDKQWLIDSLMSLTDRFSRESKVRADLAETTSFLFGDLPVLLQLLDLTGQERWRSQALDRIKSSNADPVRELMWGTPGILSLTRQIRDPALADDLSPFDAINLEKLFHAWDHVYDGLYLWNEDLYGSRRLILGAVHGFFGQVLPLLQRIDSLSKERCSMVLERTSSVLCRTALREPGLANWPVMLGKEGEDREPLLHYCHGAPGVVISACDFPIGLDTEVDQLLLNGGELIWKAGPLCKGSNLCHGTAGNGYTLLKLFERTGQQVWLDRARQFAMHGIEQYKNARREIGHGRFSLWTGDSGFAVFLWGCINADARFPTVDVF